MNPGDYAATLESLLRTDRPALVAMLGRRIPGRLRSVVAAEDVAQEAGLEAVRSLGLFRPGGDGSPPPEEALRRWVWQIARHRLCDVIRSHRRAKRGALADAVRRGPLDERPLESLPGRGACPAGAAGLAEDVSRLRDAIDRLPPSYREAVKARHLDGLSVDEAAARLGRTPGALLVLCSRAFKLLRRDLEAAGAGAAGADRADHAGADGAAAGETGDDRPDAARPVPVM